MSIFKISGLLAILLLCSSFSTPDETQWQKKHDKKGLTIYTRTVDGVKEFKAITVLDAPMERVVAVMADYENHTEWMSNITKVELVKKSGDKKRFLYYIMHLPWPLNNRDIIVKSAFVKNADGTVNLNVKSAPTMRPETKLTRVVDAGGYWNLKAISPDKTKVIYQYRANPVGIPSNIVGLFIVNGPLNTINGLKERLQLPQYQNADVPWL